MSILKKTSIFLIYFMLIFSISTTATQATEFLEQREEAIQRAIDAPLSQCFETLTFAYDLELTAFFLFLEENFLNKSDNTSLTNIAISRYMEFETRIDRIHQSLTPAGILPGTDIDSVEEIRMLTACRALRDEYKDLGKEKMVDHIKNSQAKKKTMVLVEKYQSINTRLQEMGMHIARMYGYLSSFRDRLPWFTEDCIQN